MSPVRHTSGVISNSVAPGNASMSLSATRGDLTVSRSAVVGGENTAIGGGPSSDCGYSVDSSNFGREHFFPVGFAVKCEGFGGVDLIGYSLGGVGAQ